MNNTATYKYYDRKGRRLAVFCRYISAIEAEIVTIACSKEDKFNKKFAQKEYNALITEDFENITTKPEINIVTIKPEKRELQTLIDFCNENYYAYSIITLDVEVLISNSELEKYLKLQL